MVLEIISPEQTVFHGEADAITLPGKDGSFGVLNNHAPIISTLSSGIVKVMLGGKEQQFEIKGGVVEVVKNKVIVLSE